MILSQHDNGPASTDALLLRLHAHLTAIKCFSGYQRIRLWDETTVRDCLSEIVGLDSSRMAVILYQLQSTRSPTNNGRGFDANTSR